jgi:transposase InsO family protein
MYCVKCKKKTETLNATTITTETNKNMTKGLCSACGKNKTSFAPSNKSSSGAASGSGFSLNSFVNNLPIEFHQFAEKGEDVPGGSFNDQQKYSFCGPGTRYEQRVREGYKGINELDGMCRLHDKFYNENIDTKTRNISDWALAHRADEIAENPMYDDVQRKDANFISGIMKTKARFGLGMPKLKLKEASWNEELADELHKPVRRKFQRRRVIAYAVDDIWSCDLVEMQEWSKENKGFRYMLNVVDVFSKFAWSIPIKNKTGLSTLEAFREIVRSSGRKPRHIWVDLGKEFYNKNMDSWLKENNINRYSTYGEHKSAVVERFNRTLKTTMWKRFTALNTRNWVDMLDKLMFDYNKRYHSTIKMAPTEASKSEASDPPQPMNNRPTKGKPKFKVKDKVRISRTKGLFEKGYLPNWSEEIYEIVKVKNTIPFTYILKDMNNEDIVGSFYTEELQKTTQEIYRIEKIIRKKKIDGVQHGLVKWLGYSNKFNEWKAMSEITNLI